MSHILNYIDVAHRCVKCGDEMQDFNSKISGMSKIEELSQNTTCIHKMHPMSKLITTLVYVVTVISFNRYSITALVPFIFYPVILMSLSETPYKPFFKRLLVALPFSAMAGISNIIFDKEILATIGGISISAGVVSFISIILKTILTVFAVLILMSTTKLTELAFQLTRMKIPSILVLQLTMTYRYISVLLKEASTMFTAYMIRSTDHKGIKFKDMGVFLGQLILRSMDRAERVYCAMKCRGFNGEYNRTCSKRINLKSYVYMIGISSLIIIFRFYNFSMLLGSLWG